MVLLYFGLLSSLLFFEFVLLKYDFLAPSFLCCFGFWISAFFLLLKYREWNVILYDKTVILVLCSNICFFLVNLAFLYKGRVNEYGTCTVGFHISNEKTIIILTIMIIAAVCYWNEICRIALYRGGIGSLSNIISNYRSLVYFSDSTDNLYYVNSIVAQLYKFNTGFGYAALYFLCQNVACGEKIKRNRNYILIIVVYLISSFLLTSRSHYINFLVAGILFFIIGKGQDTGIYFLRNKKIFIRIVCVTIIMLLAFYFMRNLFGRNNENIFWDYVANYFCGPTVGLNEYLRTYPNSITENNETFPAIGRFLFKLGIMDRAPKSQINFFFITPFIKNNVYTALRRWINDYGFVGSFILQFIFSFFFCSLYKRCKEKNKAFLTIFLGYAYVAVWSEFFDDLFFKTFISFSMILQVAIMFLCYCYIRKVRIRIGRWIL